MINACDMAFEEPAPRKALAKHLLIPVCLLATLIILLAGCVVILASVPPVDRDALTHHLAVPKLYLKLGGMAEIPAVPFSYYPMNLDLLYLIPLYFGNDIVPKYIHFAFALLTAWLIYGYLHRRLAKPFWGLLGAFMFLSLPVIVKLSVTVYVDLGLIFFSTASLLHLLKWVENGYRLRHLILSGVFCGLALGTKYNALISLFLLACLVPILYVRGEKIPTPNRGHLGRARLIRGSSERAPGGVSSAALFVTVALLVYSPWMVRNILWTGNPLYPLYQGVFSSIQQQRAPASGDVSASAEADDLGSEAGSNHFVARRLAFNESLLGTLTIPLRIFFQGQDDNPRLFDGRLNPYLIIFPFFAFFFGKQARKPSERIERTYLLGFSILYILFAFFQADMRIRYVGPAIPPLVILSTLGAHHLIGAIADSAHRGRAVVALAAVGTVLVWLLGQNLSYVVDQFRVIDPLSYLEGSLTRDQYIQKYRAEYEVIRYTNTHLPPDEKIFCLFMGNRIYYSDHDMLQGDGFFKSALLRSPAAVDVTDRLMRMGVRHLLVRMDVLQLVAGGFDPDTQKRLGSFFKHEVDPVYVSQGYGLFRLRESSS
jgi:4-amino-4-deoxy-L-arabinose transferase-like glycosyltransferase